MTTAPMRPCPVGNCPKLLKRGERRCDEHDKADRKAYDHERGSAASRGYGSHHRAWRNVILARYPVCKIGVKCGGTKPSTIADHIIPLEAGGTFADDNGQGCCQPCHDWKRAVLDKAGITIEQWRASHPAPAGSQASRCGDPS